MAISTPWVGTTVQGNGNSGLVLSGTADVSGAPNGDVVFIIGALGDAETAQPTFPAGWTVFMDVVEGTSGASSSRLFGAWKVKQSTDGSISVSWPVSNRYQLTPISWPGVDPTTPVEGLSSALHSSGASYVTGASTPTNTNRWAVQCAESRGSTAIVAWAADAALVERAGFIGSTSPFVAQEVADSNGPVTQASHTYTATGQTASHGASAVFYLIPAAVSINGHIVEEDGTSKILLENGTDSLVSEDYVAPTSGFDATDFFTVL